MKVDNYQDSFSIGASMAFHFCRWIHIKGFLQSFVHKQQLCVYSVLSSKHIVCILEVLISIYVAAKKRVKQNVFIGAIFTTLKLLLMLHCCWSQ